MHLSRIDTSQIEAALAKREELVKMMIKHRAAPTALPGIERSYGQVFVIGSVSLTAVIWCFFTMGVSAGLSFAALYGVFNVPVALMSRSERRAGRHLAGTHADARAAFQDDVKKCLHAIGGFNRGLAAFETHQAAFAPEDRKRIAARLAGRRAEILETQDKLLATFDRAFEPCVEHLERLGAYSRIEDRRLEAGDNVIALIHLLPAEEQGLKSRIRALQQAGADDEALSLSDPEEELNARFAALEAADTTGTNNV